ncbi:hypothetical protein L2E82_10582 [Cichorium intybus]|uniref:Uncharacterized protein n=1 Tax=Cichorium intybus TaxID=13427 RepID=A0ACB9GBL4_CICIN|nr:hypothetical protein L2E82_10582 [Cichorium intybus]
MKANAFFNSVVDVPFTFLKNFKTILSSPYFPFLRDNPNLHSLTSALVLLLLANIRWYIEKKEGPSDSKLASVKHYAILIKKKLPKVNRVLAKRLLEDEELEANKKDTDAADTNKKPFSKMIDSHLSSKTRFQV